MRTLVRAPGHALTIIVVVALGVAVNTAVFAIFDGMVFRTLAVPRPERLVHISGGGDDRPGISYGIIERLKQRTDLFEGIAGWSETPKPVEVNGETRIALVSRVDPDIHRVMGARAMMGRVLTTADAGPVAVVSAQFWRDRLASDPAALGRTVRSGDFAFTIVGVMPFAVSGMNANVPWDVTVPMDAVRTPGMPPKSALLMDSVARLRPGVSPVMAQGQLAAIWPALLSETRPPGRTIEQWRDDIGSAVVVSPAGRGRFFYRKVYRGPLTLLLAMAALLMLVVCSNLATILLARGMRRQRELAIRMALGANRLRLARAALSETLLLCAAGCLLSLAVARILIAFGVSFLPSGNIPFDYQIGLNGRTMAAAVLLSFATAILCGLWPALRTTRIDLGDAMRQTGGVTRAGTRVRKLLMAGQVAAALVLVTGAILFGVTLAGVSNAPLGFEAGGVHALLVQGKQGAAPAGSGFFDELARRLAALPGVERVAMANELPMQYAGYGATAEASTPGGETVKAEPHCALPGYFDTLRAPLLTGRDLRPGDRGIALVNQQLAARLFGNGDALGRRLRVVRDRKAVDLEVAGVVVGMRYASPREEIAPQYYVHCLDEFDGSPLGMSIAIRGGGRGIDAAARREVETMGRQYVIKSAPLAAWVRQRMLRERMLATVSSMFGLMTLGVAAVGLYGLIAFIVASRTRELSIRMAIGAQRKDVGWLIARETLTVVAAGLAAGLAASIAASRLVDAYLYGVRALDPAAMAGAAAALITVATLAALLPARRAVMLDPARVLRSE